MDRLKSGSKTKLAANIRKLSVFRILQRPISGIYNRHNKTSYFRGGNRYYYYIFQLISLFSCLPSYANTSAVANPQSNTSSSVSNFATQVLTGPMTENTYGNGIKCSGTTLSISPFATTSVAVKRPQDYIYHTPVYNEAADEDGNLTNAGEILFYRENYSGNKDATSFNFGIAATISVPLDRRFQDACLKSATTQEKIARQQLSTARLNYELARLKNCHELRVIGAEYAVNSPYHGLCADIVSKPKMNQVIPHTHKLK
jgi:hypothetical protein